MVCRRAAVYRSDLTWHSHHVNGPLCLHSAKEFSSNPIVIYIQCPGKFIPFIKSTEENNKYATIIVNIEATKKFINDPVNSHPPSPGAKFVQVFQKYSIHRANGKCRRKKWRKLERIINQNHTATHLPRPSARRLCAFASPIAIHMRCIAF